MSEPSAREWLRRLHAGECSARELVERCLRRIDDVNGALNAVIARDAELALASAERADALRRNGSRKRLLGLPVTVKDSLDVEGYVTTGGVLGRPAEPASTDATAISRLRRAGAIVVAKTNLPERSASYETDNAVLGRTNHPLDRARTPGGSSGGEAALLAADASIVGIGTDGGGSIRVPAHYCGIVGIRPTVGRVPETGCWPPTRATGLTDMLCVGPLARYVDDLRLLLPVMAGPDGIDPYAPPVPVRAARVTSLAKLRVGFYDHDPAVPATTPGTRDAVRRAVAELSRSGCHVEAMDPPDGPEATRLFFDAAAAGRRRSSRSGARSVLGAAAFFDVQRRLFDFRRRVRAIFDRFDVVVCPVVAGPAPLHGRPPAGLPDDEYFDYAGFNSTHVYAVGGVPAAVVPVSEEGGLPVGVQVVSRAYREDMALTAAGLLEESFGGFAINRRLASQMPR